jgi:non-ribosomal peptide synthetase component F
MIANRNRREVEGLIGFFVNALVMRGDLRGDPSFRELLGRTREVALAAYAHQDLPFEKLVEELRPERTVSHSPLYQVIFMYQNGRAPAVDLSGLKFTQYGADNGTTPADLVMSVTESLEGLWISVKYSTALFDAKTIRRMISHYDRLLEEITAHPDWRLLEIPLSWDEGDRVAGHGQNLLKADQFTFELNQ